jgi:hypothetical protein
MIGMENLNFKQNRLLIMLGVVAVLLLTPLVLMQFDLGVDWDAFDLLVAAFLLTTTVLILELNFRTKKSIRIKLVVTGAILFLLFLIWAELAVGIFGSPIAGN